MKNLCTLCTSLLMLATWSCKKDEQTQKQFEHAVKNKDLQNAFWDDDRWNNAHKDANENSHALYGKHTIHLEFYNDGTYKLTYDSLIGKNDSLVTELGIYTLNTDQKTLKFMSNSVKLGSYHEGIPLHVKAPYTYTINLLESKRLYLDNSYPSTETVITSEGVPAVEPVTKTETIYFIGK